MAEEQLTDEQLHASLMEFARYKRAKPESQRLCRELIIGVQQRTKFLPRATPENPNHPPFLLYEPEDRLNFAMIETIDSKKTGVVICIYGDERDHTDETLGLKMKGKPPKSYTKLAVREASQVPVACDAIARALTLKRRRLNRC
jgi:hypothetical protein